MTQPHDNEDTTMGVVPSAPSASVLLSEGVK
jgi:predicted secreted protein